MGGDWTEARTSHFVLKSDLEERELRELAQEFEASYRAIQSCVYPNGDDPPGESHVVLLGSWEEYTSIRPEGSAAFYTTRRSPFETTPLIVLPARKRDRMLEVFQHELVHRFIRHYFPSAPRWLHEGLAQVLSTATIEDDGVIVGRELARMHWDGARWTVFGMSLPDLAPDLDDLTTMNSAIFMQEAVHAYPGSFAFVHTLLLGSVEHQHAFGAYLGDLRGGLADERKAFERHFAELIPDVEREYRLRMTTENLPTQVYPLVGKTANDITLRAMPSAEAHALWGRLRMDTPDGRIQSTRDAELALASDPRSPEGYLLRATLRLRVGGVSDAQKDIRKALGFAPADQRLTRALGTLLVGEKLAGKSDVTKELDEVTAKVRAGATSADDFLFLAKYELSNRRPDLALPLAIRAAKADEGCDACLETAAFAASETGNAERAVRFQETALRVAGEFDEDLPRMEARLEKYRRQRARAPTGTAPPPPPPQPVR